MRNTLFWLMLPGCFLAPGDETDSSNDTDASDDTDTGGTDDSPGVYAVPIYDTTGDLPSTFEADLSDITELVIEKQGLGANLPDLEILDGELTLGAGWTVRLVEAYKVECPEEVPDCDVTDSEALGVGENALVADFDFLRGTIRNQGERGTCVAFGINAAYEALYARSHGAVDLSEQNTYLQGKAIEGDWEEYGLYVDIVLEGLTEIPVPFVEEEVWPYNPDDLKCDDYLEEYPDATCSETNAQGGGDDDHEPDPAVLDAPGFRIAEAHRLYASLGRMKQALYRGYPVVASINANSDFNIATYKAGVVSWALHADSCSSVCGHAVTIVGYQDDPDVDGGGYVIIKNSWSENWADDGLAYATYEWVENSLLDASAIVETK